MFKTRREKLIERTERMIRKHEREIAVLEELKSVLESTHSHEDKVMSKIEDLIGESDEPESPFHTIKDYIVNPYC